MNRFTFPDVSGNSTVDMKMCTDSVKIYEATEMPTLICKKVSFLSENDELMFFEWISRI